MKKILTGAALGCALALGAAACSNPSSGGSSAPAASGSLNPTASLKGVTLTFWTAQNSVGEPKQVISAFEKARP
jgi:raffinose/stachyose/melibiose transport system substrate-binding protein